jgi:hypothetical protein
MSATQVHSALVFFYHFGSVLLTTLQLSLIEVLQGMKTPLQVNPIADKWGWYGVMHRLTGSDISKLDAITRLPLLECLTWLSYETDLNVQNKVKLNSN